MSSVVAQGYDGASAMSSGKNGLQAKVEKNTPMSLMYAVVLTF